MDQLQLACADDALSRAMAGRVRALLESRPDTLAVVWMVFESTTEKREQLMRVSLRLLEGEVDVAVVPADRLSLDLPAGIALGAVIRDRSSLYSFVSAGPRNLSALAPGSRIATCDVVARAQLLHRFPSVSVDLAPACGDVLDGLRKGAWDAACMPAGLLESGSLSGLHYGPIEADEVLPAVGTGAVAVLVREGPRPRHDLVGAINDPESAMTLQVERSFLRNGPCGPGRACSARATLSGRRLGLEALVADEEGAWLVREAEEGDVGAGDSMARGLAARIGARAQRRRGA